MPFSFFWHTIFTTFLINHIHTLINLRPSQVQELRCHFDSSQMVECLYFNGDILNSSPKMTQNNNFSKFYSVVRDKISPVSMSWIKKKKIQSLSLFWRNSPIESSINLYDPFVILGVSFLAPSFWLYKTRICNNIIGSQSRRNVASKKASMMGASKPNVWILN